MSPSSDQHAILTLEPGDEVVDSIRRATMALGGPFVVVGAGEVEDAELTVVRGPTGRTERKLKGPADLVTITGYADGTTVELRAVLAHENDNVAAVVGGLLERATAVSVRVGLTGRIARASARVDPPVPVAATTPARQPAFPSPAASPSPASPTTASPPVPPKIGRVSADFDVYPEENDVVTHFAFGRCVVLFSDGERLRVQQDRDGRVREVALSMLRIGAPTVLADGRKHWDLARKN